MGTTRAKYTLEFKLEAVRLVRGGDRCARRIGLLEAVKSGQAGMPRF